MIAGKKNKERLSEKNEARNALALAFVRAVEVVQPKFVLMENVRGFANHPVWPQVVARLNAAGYAINARIVDMSRYGLMQKRKRFIMLAAKGKIPPSFPQTVAPPTNCRAAFENLPGGPMTALRQSITEATKLRLSGVPPCQIRENDGKYFRYKYSRINWNRLAFTMTGQCLRPGSGPFVHPTETRGLNAREALRLQSFGDAYAHPETQGIKAIGQQIGNAFPPLVAAHNAAQFMH